MIFKRRRKIDPLVRETEVVPADSEFWWERDEREEAVRGKALAKLRSIRGNGKVPPAEIKIRKFRV